MELYPPQQAVVDKVLAAPLRRHLLSAEMGCGKSAMASRVCRALGAKRVLVVAPAVTRQGWLRELDIWWPEHGQAASITLGRTREKGLSKPALARKDAAFSAPIQIVSYDLASEVDIAPWDVIIFDEVHRAKSPTTKQTKAAFAIARANPQAAILLLTGTPMADKPTDIWCPLDLAWPERFGKPWNAHELPSKFKNRYSNRELKSWPGGSAWNYFGINEVHVGELRDRLAAVSSRLTKGALAAHLPPLITQTVRIPRVKGDFTMPGREERDLLQTLMRVGEEKIGPALDWLEDAVLSAKKIVVFTYGVELAEEIARRAAKLKGAPPVICITGKVVADKRQGLVDSFKAMDSALCVASMKSVGIGINGLDCATDVLFAELYYRPETLSQALGRFNRLSSKLPTTISLLILEGTLDEALAMKLQNKINAINQAIKAGQAEEGLEKALGETDNEEAFLAELHNYSNLHIDDIDYLT